MKRRRTGIWCLHWVLPMRSREQLITAHPNQHAMPKFILERCMNTAEFMRYREQHAKQLLTTTDPEHSSGAVRWLQSIVTKDKVYDIYEAPKTELMMDFASYEGLPIRSLQIITSILKPDQEEDPASPEKML